MNTVDAPALLTVIYVLVDEVQNTGRNLERLLKKKITGLDVHVAAKMASHTLIRHSALPPGMLRIKNGGMGPQQFCLSRLSLTSPK